MTIIDLSIVESSTCAIFGFLMNNDPIIVTINLDNCLHRKFSSEIAFDDGQ